MLNLITDEEKTRFLQLIRDGDDRATAAHKLNPEYTGTMFRAMCRETSKHYDHDFAIGYQEALVARGPLNPNRTKFEAREPRRMTTNGFTRWQYITPEQIEQFLELVRNGVPTHEAARQIDPPTSLQQLNTRAVHDDDFAADFHEAREEGYPFFQEKLRSETVRQAFNGDYRALRDLNMVHLPEFKQLIAARAGDGKVDVMQVAREHFKSLPPAVLDQVIALIEAPRGEAAA